MFKRFFEVNQRSGSRMVRLYGYAQHYEWYCEQDLFVVYQFGFLKFRKHLKTITVPEWAYIDASVFGFTDWRSPLVKMCRRLNKIS